MKKRVFSLFMALALCLSMLPAAAMAEGGGESGHTHCICGAEHKTIGDHENEEQIDFATKLWYDAESKKLMKGEEEWKSQGVPASGGGTTINYVLSEGNYYLGTDITVDRVIIITGDATLCLNGNSITGKSYATNVIGIHKDVKFTLTDCKGYGEITHALGSEGRGIYVNSNATFDMYGGNITGNNNQNKSDQSNYNCGAGLIVWNNATFNLYGGLISDNTARNGGGVFASGSFNMYGGEITENNASNDGAGVYYNSSSGSFTMTGGSITGNNSARYGGVFVGSEGPFTMTGGSIIRNTAGEGGSGVFVNVYNEAVSTFTVSGDVTIQTNGKDGNSDNVYLEKENGKTASITIGKDGLADSARIGVRAKEPAAGLVVATGATENKDYTKIITSDDDTYEVAHDSTGGTKLVLVENTPAPAEEHKHCICGETHTNVGDHTSKSETTFATKLWMDGDTLKMGDEKWTLGEVERADSSSGVKEEGYALSEGTYYLGTDLELSGTAILIDGDVKLCLNGHTIDQAYRSGAISSLIRIVGKNAHLTLTDCVGTGKLTGGKYGGVDVFGGCTLDMFGGTITGNEINGGVSIGQIGTFNMYDGKITGNRAKYGGGVLNGGTFNMYGGEISGNTATSNGGGVYVDSYSTVFKVSGAAKITGNTVDEKANNVYLPSGKTFTLGSHFTRDTYIGVTTEEKPTDKKHVTIVSHAGTMSYDNVVKADDSENYKTQMDGADLVLALKNGGTTPTEHEHFLCGGDSCTCPVTETKKVEFQPWESTTSLPKDTGNYYLTANVELDSYWKPADGIVLCLNGYSITMNGSDEAIKVGKNVTFTLTDCKGGKSEYGKITHGTAGGGSKYTDNGVDVSSGGTFNMYGGSIAGNTGTCGGVYMNYATFNMYGGSITENTANNGDGGGVFMRNGTFNMSGGSITGNTTTSIGGGVYVIQGGEFTMSGGSITNNIATKNGGGVYVGSVYSVSTGTFAVSGNVNITGNKVGEKLNNVYLYSGRTITIGGELTGKIGVTTATDPTEKRPVTIATAGSNYTITESDKDKFNSDKEGYEIKYNEGEKELRLAKESGDPTPGKVDAGVKITAKNANDPAPTEVVYGDTFKLGTTLKTTGTAGRPITSDWTWTSSDPDVLSVTGNGSAATVRARKSGKATITVTYESENAIGTATATITVTQRQISVKVDDKEMTVGGALPTFTVTYGNFAFDDTADTVLETKTPSTAAAADGKTAGTFDITVEAPTIKSNYADKYTVGTPQKGTLTVNAAENPPQPSSGSSSRPSYSVSTPGKTENGSVSADVKNAKKGSTVTITVKPEDGFKLADLTVTDKDGNELALTDKGDGKYTFTMPAGKVEISAAFAEEIETSPFEDVAADAYYYEAVKWAAEQGITEGTGKGLFGPEGTCTRGQIVTFLWRAAGSPVVNYAMDLADIDEDAYYAEAVRWALSEGVTSGTTDTTFAPDATCTRAQAMTFLFKAMKAAAEGKADFKDVADSDWFASAVAWAVENGVTAGVGGGLFGPDNDCTRGQIVTFLWKLYAGK